MEQFRGGRQLIASLPDSQEILELNEGYSISVKMTLCLPENEAKHALSVLRIRKNETIRIFDPIKQLVAFGEISQVIEKKTAEVSILKIEKFSAPKHSVLIGLPENKTAEDCVESLTAIGAKSICFFKADFSQNKKNANTKFLERLLKKRDAAIKQSFASYAPKIFIFDNLTSAINSEVFKKDLKITLFSPTDEITLKRKISNIFDLKSIANKLTSSNLLIIGPEGGFSLQEIEVLLSQDSCFLTLGKNVLKVAIAANLALASINCFAE